MSDEWMHLPLLIYILSLSFWFSGYRFLGKLTFILLIKYFVESSTYETDNDKYCRHFALVIQWFTAKSDVNQEIVSK